MIINFGKFSFLVASKGSKILAVEYLLRVGRNFSLIYTVDDVFKNNSKKKSVGTFCYFAVRKFDRTINVWTRSIFYCVIL